MRLHELIKSKGLRNKAVRRGRGNATGSGNYSGRGLKGQKSRSGHSMKPFFEGGQTSIVQRLPKARGFTRYYKLVTPYQIVNLGKLNLDERVTDKMEISKAVLKQLGYIKNDQSLVKILGDGEYTKHLTFTDIESFSASAKEKLDNPGKASKTAGKPYAKIDKSAKKGTGTSKVARVAARIAKKAAEAKKPTTAGKPAPVKKAVEVKKAVTKPVETKKPTTVGKPTPVDTAALVEDKKVEVAAKPAAKAAPAKKPVAAKPAAKAAPAKKPVAAKPVAKAAPAKKPATKAPAKKAK